MIVDKSNYYFRFTDEIYDRIDFVHYHPQLDSIKQYRDSSLSEPFGKYVLIFDYGITASGKEIGAYKFVNIQNLSENGEINDDGIKFIDDCPDNLKLAENDILISRSRLVGKCAKVTKRFAGEAFGSYIIRFRLLPDTEYSVDFIVRYVNCKFGQEQVILLRTGASGENINSGQLMDIQLPMIDKEKQKHIIEQVKPIEVKSLSLKSKTEQCLTESSKIILNELGIDTPINKICYFFKQGRQDTSDYYYRFNEDVGNRFHYLFNHPKLEILDELKNKYQTVSLKSICREPIKRGEQPEYSDFGIMVIKTVDLKSRFIDYENTLRVSEDFYESKPKAHIEKNDILLSSTGYVSLGKIDVFEIDQPAFADGHISIIRLNDDYDPYFVTYFIRSLLGQIQFEKWFTGSSGQIEIQPEDLNEFILPSKNNITISRQKEIADKITEEYKNALDYESQAQAKWKEAKELFEKLILRDLENL
jgi:hypothetical protein